MVIIVLEFPAPIPREAVTNLFIGMYCGAGTYSHWKENPILVPSDWNVGEEPTPLLTREAARLPQEVSDPGHPVSPDSDLTCSLNLVLSFPDSQADELSQPLASLETANLCCIPRQ